MTRPRNVEVIRRQRQVADLYLQGMVQTAIAEVVNVTQAQVSRDLKALQQQWRESSLIDLNEAKARELAKVDRLEREYWVAWVRSCEDAETVKQHAAQEANGPKVTTVDKTVKGQAGDPRFLAGVQWCIERRCKIIGVDAATKIESSGNLHVVEDWYSHPTEETLAEAKAILRAEMERDDQT